MIFMILLWFFYFFQLEDRIKRCGVPIRMVVSVASIMSIFITANEISFSDINRYFRLV